MKYRCTPTTFYNFLEGQVKKSHSISFKLKKKKWYFKWCMLTHADIRTDIPVFDRNKRNFKKEVEFQVKFIIVFRKINWEKKTFG